MNLLKKPFSISLQALAGVLIFSCLLAHPFSEAASSPPGDKRDYMLVLNTYTESAPWSSHIINSIVAHIDQVDNFEVYTENMNSLLMTFKNTKPARSNPSKTTCCGNTARIRPGCWCCWALRSPCCATS